MEAEPHKKDMETLDSGFVVASELRAGEIGVGVLFLDELLDVVTRSPKGNVVRLATGHSGVQDGDQLALRVEDSCARVTLSREITVLPAPPVEDRNLPGLANEIATGVRLELGLATKGKIGRLPGLGNGEARVVVLVEEVRVREGCGVDETRELEQMVLRVLECRGVGGVGVEAGDDLVAGELAGCRIAFALDENGKKER